MNYIELQKIVTKGNRCEYEFDFPSELEPYIADLNNKLFFELPDRIPIESVPESILAVPFVGSMLSVTMLSGIGIKVPVIDKEFYESIPRIRESFKKMFPYADFCFDVSAGEVVGLGDVHTKDQNRSLFFTGGMDATSALIDRIDEKPTLINIFGGDLLLTDISGKNELEKYISRLTSQIGNDYVMMVSSCRRFFNEKNLEDLLYKIIKPEHNHGWWASIAHILSMTSTIAPVLYSLGISTHYIGSSYPEKSNGFDSNNVDMVNSIRIAGCTFKMVDEDLDRSAKAKKIVSFCEKNNRKVELKVCCQSTASENCSHCEKCYRTIAEIISKHADPNQYGFKFDRNGYKEMRRFLKYNYVNSAYWEANKAEFLREYDYWKNDRNMSWMLDFEFNKRSRMVWHGRFLRVKYLLYIIKHKIFG